MALIWNYLNIKNATDAEIDAAGNVGWELFIWKGSDAWFKQSQLI